MPTILITGANRGIGRTLSESYLADGWRVLGTSRQTSDTLAPGVEHFTLDLANPSSVQTLADSLKGVAIDVLWNNAGVYLDKGTSLQTLSDQQWLDTFAINTIAPIRIAQALHGNLRESARKVIVFTTSKMGSLAVNGDAAYAYRSSKTALNMAVRCLANEVHRENTSCLLLHPGHVKTDMGGPEGDITVEQSVAGMRAIVDKTNVDTLDQMSNRYYDVNGSIIPW